MAVDAYTYEVELKDGAAEYLRYLKEKGIRMAVATSSSPELYEPALKRNGIYEYFKAFVTVSEVKRGKGFPDIYEKAAEKLSLPPETCVVYEDILTGIRGAKWADLRLWACMTEAGKETAQRWSRKQTAT